MRGDQRFLEAPIGEQNLQDQRIGERRQAEIDARQSQRWRADYEGGKRRKAMLASIPIQGVMSKSSWRMKVI